MPKPYRIILIGTGLLMMLVSGYIPIKANGTTRPEIRALWVDAFRDGIKSPAQIDRLVQDAVTANINTLIVQVRRRGDAYYNHSLEPRTEDPTLCPEPEFDPLQYLIDKAHSYNLEVHAWLNTLVAWNSSVPPANPNHVWNLHGPQTEGRANWISYYRTTNKTTKKWSNTLQASYYLDPGHPDAVDYTVAVYLNVVKHYAVDGIHLDYSRYAGMGWGYNPTSIARYNAQFGKSGMPAPDDPCWAQWRREQITNLVRKIYLKAIALKPALKVSAAVIAWGDGPVAPGDWKKSRAYVDLGQDWQGWLAEGIIDMVIPMNYFKEWNPIEQLKFNQWIEWEKDHQHSRQIVIGSGIFTQYIEHSLEQIRRAQAPSALGNYAAGVSLFAYGASHLYSSSDFKEPAQFKELPRQPHIFMPETNSWLFPLLSQAGEYTDPVLKTVIATQPIFPAPAVIPDMPWKSRPVNGYLMGTVSGPNGKTYDHLKVTVDSLEASSATGAKIHRTVYTDGSGWYGLTELPPGNYKITIDIKDSAMEKVRQVEVQAGRVAEVTFK